MDWPKLRERAACGAGAHAEREPPRLFSLPAPAPEREVAPASDPSQSAPAIDFAKTQLLPIEQVAKVLEAHRARAPRPAFDGARTQKISAAVVRAARAGRGAPRTARGAWAALCALVLVVASSHGPPCAASRSPTEVAARRPEEPPQPERRQPVRLVPPTPNPPPAPPLPAAPAARAQPDTLAPAVSPRKAVDALAAGDTARAAALYAALAARAPRDRALATAARILRARAGKPAAPVPEPVPEPVPGR